MRSTSSLGPIGRPSPASSSRAKTFEPYYILFEDFTHVKFYRYSLRAVVEREGGSFDRFVHVDDWVPPVVRTATKGDDPRRTP